MNNFDWKNGGIIAAVGIVLAALWNLIPLYERFKRDRIEESKAAEQAVRDDEKRRREEFERELQKRDDEWQKRFDVLRVEFEGKFAAMGKKIDALEAQAKDHENRDDENKQAMNRVKWIIRNLDSPEAQEALRVLDAALERR